ncbi:HVA22-like protein k [Impatiens glandulifera]|uniref:HVA22-like protein k n=1 Tax=Impatiens glandulifera TaxID=253017 RepID=UPI001FB16AE0|nr:HVA22-like protein k [Impatiens glandulifera]
MSLFGSNIIPNEVGLKLLLYPLGSNVVIRTACCSVGVVLPVYSTFKAIETKNQHDQQRLLIYWAAYGSFTIAESFTDKIVSWVPFYYHMKFAFLVWLQLPSTEGAKYLYMNHLHPFFTRHQGRLDQVVGFLHSEMVKFVTLHQGEIQLVRTIVLKILALGGDIFQPEPRPVAGAIEGPIQPSVSEEEINGPVDGPNVEHIIHPDNVD